MSQPGPALSWTLFTILEVDYSDRVRCQCKHCKQTVYKRVHLIGWSDGRIECWGSTCYARELGATTAGRTMTPLYGDPRGRKLTPEEREWLRGNTEKLITSFREAFEREVNAKRERTEAAQRALEEAERQRREAESARASRARDVAIDLLLGPSRSRPLPAPAPPRVAAPSVPRAAPPLEREGVCEFCGQVTRDWWSYHAGSCKCNDCKRRGIE